MTRGHHTIYTIQEKFEGTKVLWLHHQHHVPHKQSTILYIIVKTSTIFIKLLKPQNLIYATYDLT